MNALANRGAAFRDWYTRNALGVIFFVLALTLASLIIGVIGTFVNATQNADRAADNKRRDEQNAAVLAAQQKLLDCFDEYAADSSAASVKVRAASAAKDVATARLYRALAEEGIAFKELTGKLLTGAATAADVKRLNETLGARAAANQAVLDAQAALDRARAENPVPDPPSEICKEKGPVPDEHETTAP